jgi:chromosome segregation ATPase
MYLLATPFTFIEIAVFAVAVVAFLLAVRFFIASQKRLENLFPDRRKKESHFSIGIDRDGFLVPTGKQSKKALPEKEEKANTETREEMRELRNMLQLQQLELTRALRQIESLNTAKHTGGFDDDDYDEKDDYEKESDDFDERYSPDDDFLVEELRGQLTKKEAEVKDLRQQADLNQKLQAHFEDIEASYDELQEKVQKMEAQAWQSAELAIKIDELEQSVDQLEKSVQKKEEKIRELGLENGRLHEMLNQTEDKLSEANLQRQQLFKKVHFLEQINSDIQQMSDANRKLKTELRRVAELESMLNLITEERDVLLKRKRF